MSRKSRVAAAVVVGFALLIPVVVTASPGDPFRTTELTPAAAAEQAAAFVGGPVHAQNLTVRGPVEGSLNRIYQVQGEGIAANVDAHSGAVLTLLVTESSAVSAKAAPVGDAAAARTVAQGFLRAHGVGTAGLDESVRFADHGERSEYVVEWTRRVGVVIVPDIRIVGVDAATGQVFRYINMSRPFANPGKPTVEQAAAEASASEIVGQVDDLVVDEAALRIVFSEGGGQRLVWNVRVSGTVDVTADGTSVPGHWLVEVDAESGATTLLTAG